MWYIISSTCRIVISEMSYLMLNNNQSISQTRIWSLCLLHKNLSLDLYSVPYIVQYLYFLVDYHFLNAILLYPFFYKGNIIRKNSTSLSDLSVNCYQRAPAMSMKYQWLYLMGNYEAYVLLYLTKYIRNKLNKYLFLK